MHIAIMTVTLMLPGCSSLKEKRQRIGGLHERLGRHPGIAVCESGHRSALGRAEWSFVVTGMSKSEIETLFANIEEKLKNRVDGYPIDISREYL